MEGRRDHQLLSFLFLPFDRKVGDLYEGKANEKRRERFSLNKRGGNRPPTEMEEKGEH